MKNVYIFLLFLRMQLSVIQFTPRSAAVETDSCLLLVTTDTYRIDI